MEENEKLDMYSLSRNFWDYSFNNPEKINTNHAAIYFFAIEHCNRLGWKSKFGLPSTMVMEATGIKNWRTYSKALKELIDFGLIILLEKSTNQYSSNIIAIVKNTKAQSKALDKALQKHSQKQSQSKASIDIQDTTKQLYNYTNIDVDFFKLIYGKPAKYISEVGEAWKIKHIWQIRQMLEDFNNYLLESYKKHATIELYINHFINWGKTRFLNYQHIPDPDAEMRQHERELEETRQRMKERDDLINLRQKEQDERDAAKEKVNS